MTAPRMYMGANMLLLVNGDGTHVLIHRDLVYGNYIPVVLPRVPASELTADLWPTDADRMKSAARAGYEANRAAVQ